MADRSAGSASIRVRPDATGFPSELRTKLSAVKDPGFTIDVNAEFAQARADIDRFRQSQQRNGMRLGVDVALGQAQADMAAFRARQRADGVVVKVDADTGKARAEVASLRRQLGDLDVRKPLLLNAGAIGVAAFQPAVAGLAQVAAGIQTVIQAGLVLPGVMAGAAASISTLVLGLSGIKDAYDAVSAAAESSGTDQAAQARAATAASNQLRNAVVDEGRAQRDVARATADRRRELRDLVLEQRGGMLDESRAILEAQKAREDLQRGNFSDVRDAALRVMEADQRVAEVRARNADSAEKLRVENQKGVAASDSVVAANETLVRSQQQVADAQAAVADASSKSSAAQDKAADAMNKLGPNAQEVVRTLIEMKPAFEEFRTAASQPLLEGKAEEFRRFFDNVAPTLQSGIAGIAAGFNQNISALFGAVGSDEGKGLIDRILGNTGDAQARLSGAMEPLVRGLGALTAAGSDALPRLADGFTAVMDRFANFITAADQDGRLEKWINDGLDGLSSLGNTVINLGKAFTGITSAAGGGGSFLRWLEDATGRLQTFLNSAEGQNKIREYLQQGKEMAEAFMPVLRELPGAFASIQDAAQTYVGGLLPILREAAELIGDHPDLVKAVVTAYLGWQTIRPIVGGVQTAIGGLGAGLTALGTGFADTRARAENEMAKTGKAFDGAGGPKGVGKLAGALNALGGAGGPMMILTTAAIPTLMGAMDKLNAKNREAAEVTRQLEQDQRALETTLDRVTGKVTAATRDQAISSARDYAPDGPGSGIPGISQGNALAAATSLGIAPDLYADALVGKPEAVKQVRDILTKNNLLPEFAANPELTGIANSVRGATGDKVNQDTLIAALLGDQSALKAYEEGFAGTGIDYRTSNTYSLASIAQRLSATGQASVLSGGALNRSLGALPGASTGVQEQNQANFGRFKLSQAGSGFFGQGADVRSSGSDYKVSAAATPGLLAALRASSIPFIENSDGTVTASVPLTSPYIEKYKQGSRGVTPGGKDQGFLAMLHGQEWVHDAGTVDRYGPDVMNAMWRGQIDPKALRSLLPHFDVGGPTDPYLHNGTGAAPGPVAPNPYQGGGIDGIVGNVLAGAQNSLTGLVDSAVATDPVLGLPTAHGASATGPGPAAGATPPVATPNPLDSFLSGLSGLVPGLNLAGSNSSANGDSDKKTPGEWLANWGATNLLSFSTTLLSGALGMVGAEGLMNSPYITAIGKTIGHFGSLAGTDAPGSTAAAGTGSVDFKTLIDSAAANGITLTPETLEALYGGFGSTAAVAPAGPGDSGLQTNTLRGKQIIQKNFAWATDIGGVRKDRLKWHPNGLALDVMIPGAGGLNDPTPAAGKAQGDQLYAWLNSRKNELGIDYIMWQEKDHYNHLHVNFAPSGFPSMDSGGPTPNQRGNADGKGGHFAIVHPEEFMISARGRATVPDEFLHALNQGLVDPKDLPGFAIGGPINIRAGAIQPPRPRPNFDAGPGARTRVAPPPTPPTRQAPVAAPPVAVAPPAPPPPPPVAQQPEAPAQQPPVAAVAPASVAPGGETTHTLPWVDTAITSGASAIGSAADTAAAVASFGASGGLGGGLGGGAGGLSIGGVIQQGGKIVSGIANVISSALVGSTPGSFTTTPEAYGRTMRPEQREPATAMSGRGPSYGPFYGHDTKSVMQAIDLNESIHQQTALAARRRR